MNEDVFPIENEDFPASHASFQGWKCRSKIGCYKSWCLNRRLDLRYNIEDVGIDKAQGCII